jgi:hypothetical protein
MNPLDQPAFPEHHYFDPARGQHGIHMTASDVGCGGISLRVHAAIELRVPESGIPQLDDMIREARRLDYAGQAMAGILANAYVVERYGADAATVSKDAYHFAAAMMPAGRQEGA